MATKPLVSKVHDKLDKLEMDTRKAIKEKPENGKFLVDEFTKRVDDIAIDGLTDDQKKEYKSAVDKKVKDLTALVKSLTEKKRVNEGYKLSVRYKNKKTGETYTREYDYSGETDRTKLQWLKDVDKVAFGNCKSDEDVMGYNLIKESKRGNMGKKNLKEEYGYYKDEPFCDEIADALEDGIDYGDVDGVSWSIDIDGYTKADFKSLALFEFLLRDISYPVRDGHLSYMGLDEFIYADSFDSSDNMDDVIADLRNLFDIDDEQIQSLLNDEDYELEFYVDYDTNFDVDEWELQNDLPTEVEIDVEDLDHEPKDDNDLYDLVGYYLSDTYGCYAVSFDTEWEPGDGEVAVINIEWECNESLKNKKPLKEGKGKDLVAYIDVSQATIDKMNKLLDLTSANDDVVDSAGYDRGSNVFMDSVEFEDGYFADIRVEAGDHNFYMNPVLFNKDGYEVSVLDADDLDGEYDFYDGKAPGGGNHIVIVRAKEEKKPVKEGKGIKTMSKKNLKEGKGKKSGSATIDKLVDRAFELLDKLDPYGNLYADSNEQYEAEIKDSLRDVEYVQEYIDEWKGEDVEEAVEFVKVLKQLRAELTSKKNLKEGKSTRKIEVVPGYYEWLLNVDGETAYTFGDLSDTISFFFDEVDPGITDESDISAYADEFAGEELHLLNWDIEYDGADSQRVVDIELLKSLTDEEKERVRDGLVAVYHYYTDEGVDESLKNKKPMRENRGTKTMNKKTVMEALEEVGNDQPTGLGNAGDLNKGVQATVDVTFADAVNVNKANRKRLADIRKEKEKEASGITPKDPESPMKEKNMFTEKLTLDESLFEAVEDDCDVADKVAKDWAQHDADAHTRMSFQQFSEDALDFGIAKECIKDAYATYKRELERLSESCKGKDCKKSVGKNARKRLGASLKEDSITDIARKHYNLDNEKSYDGLVGLDIFDAGKKLGYWWRLDSQDVRVGSDTHTYTFERPGVGTIILTTDKTGKVIKVLDRRYKPVKLGEAVDSGKTDELIAKAKTPKQLFRDAKDARPVDTEKLFAWASKYYEDHPAKEFDIDDIFTDDDFDADETDDKEFYPSDFEPAYWAIEDEDWVMYCTPIKVNGKQTGKVYVSTAVAEGVTTKQALKKYWQDSFDYNLQEWLGDDYLDEGCKGKKCRKKLGESSKRDDIDAKRDNRVERARKTFNKVRDDADAQRDDRLKKRGLRESKETDQVIKNAKHVIDKLEDIGDASLEVEDIGALKKLKKSIDKVLDKDSKDSKPLKEGKSTAIGYVLATKDGKKFVGEVGNTFEGTNKLALIDDLKHAWWSDTPDSDSYIKKLSKEFGVELVPKKVIIDRKTAAPISLKESKNLKESWECEDLIDDIVDSAKSIIEDGYSEDDAVRDAIDNGLIYTDDVYTFARHYGSISDSELIESFYDDLYNDVYSRVQGYANEYKKDNADRELDVTLDEILKTIKWTLDDVSDDGVIDQDLVRDAVERYLDATHDDYIEDFIIENDVESVDDVVSITDITYEFDESLKTKAPKRVAPKAPQKPQGKVRRMSDGPLKEQRQPRSKATKQVVEQLDNEVKKVFPAYKGNGIVVSDKKDSIYVLGESLGLPVKKFGAFKDGKNGIVHNGRAQDNTIKLGESFVKALTTLTKNNK